MNAKTNMLNENIVIGQHPDYKNEIAAIAKSNLTQIPDSGIPRKMNSEIFFSRPFYKANIAVYRFKQSRLATSVSSDQRYFFFIVNIKIYVA